MKAVARSYTCWPGMDTVLEEAVKSCIECQQNANSGLSVLFHLWDWPESPWSHLHVDCAGPFKGRMLLIVVDLYSKWLEVKVLKSASTLVTVKKLRNL